MKDNINIDILREDVFSLPKNRGDGHFIDFVEDTFRLFNDCLDRFDGKVGKATKSERFMGRILCKAILQCLRDYYGGYTIRAYHKLGEALDTSAERLNPSFFDSSKENLWRNSLTRLYRARVVSKFGLNREELFHPPFSIRHVLSDQRYSIRGLPCLYLSNNVYLCWEELNQPDLNNFYVARFEFSEEDLPLLNLTLSNSEIIEGYGILTEEEFASSSETLIEYYLTTWPLHFVTSVAVNQKYRNSLFKPEYIISQFLLEWVRTNRSFAGIKYLTTKKTAAKLGSSQKLINYAIPAINTKSGIFCQRLTRHIKLTYPISQSLVEALQLKLSKEEHTTQQQIPGIDFESLGLQADFTLEINPDITQQYSETAFGKLEAHLTKLPATYLDT